MQAEEEVALFLLEKGDPITGVNKEGKTVMDLSVDCSEDFQDLLKRAFTLSRSATDTRSTSMQEAHTAECLEEKTIAKQKETSDIIAVQMRVCMIFLIFKN